MLDAYEGGTEKGAEEKVLLGPLAPSPRGDEGERKKMPQLRLSSLLFPDQGEKKKGKGAKCTHEKVRELRNSHT